MKGFVQKAVPVINWTVVVGSVREILWRDALLHDWGRNFPKKCIAPKQKKKKQIKRN